jgi:hypothetical protein
MHKDVRDTVKGLKRYADPQSSFDVSTGKHIKVSWEMTNDDGEPVNVLLVMSVSPSDARWMLNHRQSLRRMFRENNITCDVL